MTMSSLAITMQHALQHICIVIELKLISALFLPAAHTP
jgi:hypothetical protein